VKIEKNFGLTHPRALVWERMCDIRLVADCLPGASIVEVLGEDRYKGRFAVRVGPMAATFDGDVAIERRPNEWTAVVTGKGADARSSSRASGQMTYRLERTDAGGTRVDIISEINLAGALAQFGKGAVLQEIASRITAEFVRNFEQRLTGTSTIATPHASAPRAADPTAPMDAGNLLWSIMRDRVAAFFRGLIRSPPRGRDR